MIGRMIHARRRRWLATASALAVMTCASTASAQDEEIPDARLAGYKQPAEIGGGSAGALALIGVLGAITVAVMFKNANRSHLD